MDSEHTQEILINIDELIRSIFRDAEKITANEVANLEKYLKENHPNALEDFKALEDDEIKKLIVVLGRRVGYVKKILKDGIANEMEKTKSRTLEIAEERKNRETKLNKAFAIIDKFDPLP